jgi:hypothetical protein
VHRRTVDYYNPQNGSVLWTLGIDPGITTGICLMAVYAASVYGDSPASIEHHETMEIHGSLESQCQHICMLARKIQGHFRNPKESYPPPCIQCEGFQLRPKLVSSSPEVLAPVRLEAMLRYAVMRGDAGNARMTPAILPQFTKETATDERLRKWGLWTPGPDHMRDASRQAIMLVRRAKTDRDLRLQAWGSRM